MTRDRIRGFCPRCRHRQVFERAELHHWVHFFLSIVTGGLWLISWISIYIGYRLRPWRCVQCNWHKPIFDTPPADNAPPIKAGPDNSSNATARPV